MAAKPARLSTNRHGTFSLRWIVPVRLRGEHGRPREVRISLRTRDYLQARILALEFNLAIARNKAMTPSFDPRTIAPWSLQAGGVKIEVNGPEDQKLFQQATRDDPDLRAALMDAMRSGMQPAEAIAALVSQVKGAVGDVAGVAQPKLLSAVIEQYVATRKVLGKNRRSTAGEKQRTLALLLQHLESQDKDKGGKAQKATVSDPDTEVQGLSPRTVLKAVGHLNDFFHLRPGERLGPRQSTRQGLRRIDCRIEGRC